MTTGSAAMSSAVNPGRGLRHLSDSAGDLGPGSITKVWAGRVDGKRAIVSEQARKVRTGCLLGEKCDGLMVTKRNETVKQEFNLGVSRTKRLWRRFGNAWASQEVYGDGTFLTNCDAGRL
jgi:hypothetical protein